MLKVIGFAEDLLWMGGKGRRLSPKFLATGEKVTIKLLTELGRNARSLSLGYLALGVY